MNSKIEITNPKEKTTILWHLAQKHPILAYLLITFGWSWLFWLAAIPLRGTDNLLLMTIVFIGGYGPAVGGILALGLQKGMARKVTGKRIALMVVGAALIFGLMILRFNLGHIDGYESLPADLSLSLPIIAAAAAASLLGGWMISAAVEDNVQIRQRMASLLPWKSQVGWTLFSLVFYPAMVLLSWALASVLGVELEYPGLWGHTLLEVLPLLLLSFVLTALARGGNEEPGWRGMMQPTLQGKMSPLMASLIVSLVWSLWHLPLYLNGFYGEPLLMGMIGGGIFRIFLAIFLTWVYNRSGGKLLPMILLHTSFNMVVNFLPTNDFLLLLLWLLMTVVVVVKDKMWQKMEPMAG